MPSPNFTTQTDLSEGSLSDETSILAKDLLEEQQQKRRFRLGSFVIAWAMAVIFLLSVLCFSYRIVNHPSQYWLSAASHTQHPVEKTDKPPASAETHAAANPGDADIPLTNPMNELLILLGLLSAVGTTLAVSVMRFSFSGDSKTKEDDGPVAISPIATSVSEVLKAAADLLKKEK